jgi:hypothetical protein
MFSQLNAQYMSAREKATRAKNSELLTRQHELDMQNKLARLEKFEQGMLKN